MTRRSQHLLDALVPLLAAAVIVAGGVVHGGDAHPIELIVGAAAGASLAGRRRAPGFTLAVSGALALLLLHLQPTAGASAVIAPAVALYSLALRRGARERAVAAVAAVVAIVAADALHGGPTLLQTLGHVLLVAIPLLIADVHLTRHANLELLQERLALAERTREHEAERRAEQQRLRIARDLHDVVAHTLTTINVQAATAAQLLDRNPAHARNALETIEDASRDAISELRAILGVLREGADRDTPLAPAPGLDQRPDLVARAREDGVDVDLEVDGERPKRLPDAVSLAAFRIAQESLTNARRHAAGADVRIALTFDPETLGLVVDNGAATVAAVNGTSAAVGIMGMRERAVTLGGTFEARPVGGGFRVEAISPTPPVIRVLVADDQDAVRGGFAALIAAQDTMLIAGEASTGREAVDLARRVFPDVVLMDIRMPVLDGLQATRLICADPNLEGTRVLVLTTFDVDEYVYEALRAGASGFLLKDTRPRELLHAIEVVAAGDALIAPRITRRLIAEFAARRDPSRPPAALAELTDREREILRLVARGLSNAEIAGRLVISPLTAKTHVGNVLRKLDCRARAALVALAYETGLITPGESD